MFLSCHSYEHSTQDLKNNSTTLLSEFCTNSSKLNSEIIHFQLQRPYRWNNHVNFVLFELVDKYTLTGESVAATDAVMCKRSPTTENGQVCIRLVPCLHWLPGKQSCAGFMFLDFFSRVSTTPSNYNKRCSFHLRIAPMGRLQHTQDAKSVTIQCIDYADAAA